MEQLDRAAREGPVEAIRINSALVAPHPSYEQRGLDPTTPVDVNPAEISLTLMPPTARSTSVRGHDHSGVARRR